MLSVNPESAELLQPSHKMRAEERGVELCLMGAEWRCRNMKTVEALSTHFDTVLINPILKGNHKCTYYPIGNANGLEVQEILSQNILLDYRLFVQGRSQQTITRASQRIKGII